MAMLMRHCNVQPPDWTAMCRVLTEYRINTHTCAR